MEALKDYPKEFAKSFRPSFKFLFKINMTFWFHNEDSFTRNWRFFYIVPAVVFHYVSVTVDLGQCMMEGEIFEIANRLPPFLIITQGILKALILFPKTSQITEVIKELGALWRTTGLSEKQIEERNKLMKTLNRCNAVTYWIAIIGTSQYLTSPIFETLFRRFILAQDAVMLFPIASSYPFDPTGSWLIYIASYAFQFYSMFLCVFAYVGSELIMITLCALLGMEFSLLCEDLLLLRASKKISKVGQISLKEIVKKHQKLISLSTQLNIVFNQMIFIDLVFVGITTCFFRYAGQFSRGPVYMISNYVAVCASMLYVLYLCYYGELLTGASCRIGDAAYESSWYWGDKNYQKTICILIGRSQNACCLTSMNYTPVTLNMFTKVRIAFALSVCLNGLYMATIISTRRLCIHWSSRRNKKRKEPKTESEDYKILINTDL